MQLQTDARAHAAGRIALADGATLLTAQAWARVDPASIVASWTAELPAVTATTTRAQYAAASTADAYVDEFDLGGAGVEDNLDPSAFAGTASDGRGLVQLLMSPAFQALQMIGSGLLAPDAMRVAGRHLDTIVRTQVADAGRVADGVAVTSHRRIEGYVRVVAGGACSRCVVLAGRWYRWNEGFLRHPNCHCVHAPSAHDVDVQDPKRLYDAMTPAQRKTSGWSAADQQAIDDGADIVSVTNARRGVYSVGGKRYTYDATSRRGTFGGYRIDPDTGALTKRARGDRAGRRLTPDQIYAEAGDDRDKAIRLLRQNGYLKPVPATVAPRKIGLAAARPGGEAAAAAGPGTVVGVRAELQAARTTEALARAFEAESRRITGRRIPADFHSSSLATAREHAEGLLRGLERFPEADLRRVESQLLYGTNTGAYAEAQGGTVRFNLEHSRATGRVRYLRNLRQDVESHFHPTGMDNPAGIALHEFGHVLDIETLGELAQPEIEQLVHAAALRAGVTDGEIVRFEVSRYAAEDVRELAAEAFADVMLNGGAASQLSRDIYAVIRRDYEAGGRKFTSTSRVVAGAARDELSRMTVPQLRALAKDRGIKVPSKARKADIVKALSEPVGPSIPPGVGPLPNREAKSISSLLVEYADLYQSSWEDRPAILERLRVDVQKAVSAEFGSGGLTVKVEQAVTVGDGYLSFSGRLVDSSGRKAGDFTRVILRDKGGELHARHVLLKLSRSAQGSGFADEFNRNLYEWYRHSGLTRVEVHANIDVGGYTWARAGFDFQGTVAAEQFLLKARRKLDTALKRTPKGLTREQVRDLDILIRDMAEGRVATSAPTIAGFGRRPGQSGKTAIWPGKWLMLRSDWYGAMAL